MSLSLIISGVFFFTLIVGFFIGFARYWVRSLVRLGILVIDFVLSLFLAPTLTNFVSQKIASGTTVSAFGTTVDFENIIVDIVGNDANIASETTNQLAQLLLSVTINLILFWAMFFSIAILSLIIYWIVLIIVKHHSEKENQQKNLGLKFLGGFEGILSVFVINLALLVPVFGFVNIIDSAIEVSEPKTQAVASAASVNNLICGETYYTESENDEISSTIVSNYKKIKQQYDSSFMGFLFRVTGTEKLEKLAFDKLTTINIEGQKVHFSTEVTSVLKTYTIVKETVLNPNFNFSEIKSITDFENIYYSATQSVFVQKYMEDLIPTLATKWSNGEEFMNLKNPVPEKFKPAFNDFLNIFSSSKTFLRIDANIRKLFEIAHLVEDGNLLSKDFNSVIEFLKNDETLVKNIVIKLGETPELKNNTPVLFDDALDLLYSNVIGDGKFEKLSSSKQLAITDWNAEAERFQGMAKNIALVYDSLVANKNNGESLSSEQITSNLGKVGKVIDLARKSEMLSDSLKLFISSVISSDKVTFGENSEQIKTDILTYIDEKWDDSDFSFEDTLQTISDTASLTIRLMNKIAYVKNASNPESTYADPGEITYDEISDVITSVASDSNIKSMIYDFINSGALEKYLGNNKYSEMIAKAISIYFEKITDEEIEKDIENGKAIYNLLCNKRTLEITQEESDQIVEALSKSKTVIATLSELIDQGYQTTARELIAKLGTGITSKLSASVNSNQIFTESEKNMFLSVL